MTSTDLQQRAPRAPEPRASYYDPHFVTEPPVWHGEARVLVVDDDQWIRECVAMALHGEGYAVETACDGEDALQALARMERAGHGAPDLILLDMRMPRMDGWAFARAYRARPLPRAPIVVITAARDAALRAADIGADGALAKPFDLDELFAVVNAFARRLAT